MCKVLKRKYIKPSEQIMSVFMLIIFSNYNGKIIRCFISGFSVTFLMPPLSIIIFCQKGFVVKL